MKIGAIIKDKQPKEHEKLKNKKRKRHPKKHLSFDDWDRLMKERSDIDERRCR